MLFQTQPDEIVTICFKRSKKLHLDCSELSEQNAKTDSTSVNIEPTESDKEEFFSNLTKLMPKSATLTAVAKQSPKPTNSSVILKLPPTLKTSLHDPKYKDLSNTDFEKACESIFQKLSITTSEATYLEESTRLQSQSKLWFDHRVGRITASKFATVSKASLNPPPPSLIKEFMGEKTVSALSVPALDWGTKNEATAREEYLKKTKQTHVSLKYRSAGFHVNVQYPHLGATPDGVIECECCGTGLIEIKCPYKYRQCKLCDIADRNFCIQPNKHGKLNLPHDHPYYLQIQGQLTICHKPYCDFIVWTECDLFVERINLDTKAFEVIKPSLDKFFKIAILPKLLCGTNTADKYCHCKGPEEGKMIACDNSNCEVEWFHFHCIGLTRKPRGFWYCSEACRLKASKQ